jgi:hypothetical protein
MLEPVGVIACRQAADLAKGRIAVSMPVSRSAAAPKYAMADEAGMTRIRCTGRWETTHAPADAVGGDLGRVPTVFDNNGSFLLAMFEFFIFFAWFMSLFWVFGDLFRSKDLGGLAKTLWTLFLIVLPILGMLVYLIARGRGMTERAVEAQADAQRRQDTYIRSVATSNGGTSSPADEIASAKALLDSGAITASEYEQLKAKALATSNASPVAENVSR